MSSDRVMRKLDRVLKAQAQLLRTGNLNGALALAPGIERLIEKLADRLEAVPASVPATEAANTRNMMQLRDQAVRNAELITAAREGVEAAREIIVQIDSKPGFQSYDAQGKAVRVGTGG